MSNPTAAPDRSGAPARSGWLDRRLHQIFELSLFFKGVFATLELAGGLLLYFVSTERVAGLVTRFTVAEISEDPKDPVASSLLNLAQGVSVGSKDFYGLYLASHGVVKLILVLGLMFGVRWAYLTSIVALAAFIAYQLYRYTFAPSLGLIALSLFDALLIALIWHEWNRSKAKHPPGAASLQDQALPK